jgi:hypothetical protein
MDHIDDHNLCLAQKDRVLHYTMLERLARDKQSSLLISHEESEMLRMGTSLAAALDMIKFIVIILMYLVTLCCVA